MNKAMNFPKEMKDVNQKTLQTPSQIFTKKMISRYIRVRCT